MKILPPTLRERKRYIVFEVISKKKISFNELKKAINNEFKKLFGEWGFAVSRIKILKWDGKKGIMCAAHNSTPYLKYSLTKTNKINKKKVIFKTIKMFGTIKKAKKYLEVN